MRRGAIANLPLASLAVGFVAITPAGVARADLCSDGQVMDQSGC